MAIVGSQTSRDDLESLGDAALVKAWRRGDGRAAEALIRRHQRAVYQLMLRCTADPSAADDLTQSAFVKTLINVESLRGEAVFQAWLMRIALNLARSRGRSLLRWRHAPEEALAKTVDPTSPADEALDRRRTLARARVAIDCLPKRQRHIVQMRMFAELPYKDIAAVMGTTEGSVKVTFHKAVRLLRERLGGMA